MESLTMEDIDLYSSITRRIQNEDILSIVTTYFMPYGIESDQYSVLGDIIEFTEEKNIITNEKIYCIKVSCNDIIFSVCINKMTSSVSRWLADVSKETFGCRGVFVCNIHLFS